MLASQRIEQSAFDLVLQGIAKTDEHPSTNVVKFSTKYGRHQYSSPSHLKSRRRSQTLWKVGVRGVRILLFHQYCKSLNVLDESVEVKDISLTDYIQIRQPVYLPHTAGRYAKKQFKKAQMPIVERLVDRYGFLSYEFMKKLLTGFR